ncbi:MAG: TonB-dependent receptor [Bacteroides sp.]|nr:TonB-dependent receptor [Bacteroides sp.]
MNTLSKIFIPMTMVLSQAQSVASTLVEEPDTIGLELQEVVVSERRTLGKLRGTSLNTEVISASDLKRAACCNLGESFTTNPSVDVSYSDAATGARQIKLLGLSGSYVQMLTENIPNFRGAAGPFGLGYIAGPWMQSIQVSKGASSVKNGFESITGQINVEMKKPQLEPSLSVNAYADHLGKAEGNFDGNIHIGDKWSTALLLHGENSFKAHDENDDGFADSPRIHQFAGMNRWAYLGTSYVFQAAVKYLDERRKSGQIAHVHHYTDPYIIDIDTRRVEAFTKNAYIFDRDNDGNVAMIASMNFHDQHADYGRKLYDVIQREAYVSAMFERKWNNLHSLSTGLSMVYDNYRQLLRASNLTDAAIDHINSHEMTYGAYGQYTLNVDNRLIAMAGVRGDHSSRYGWMFTPRLHVRYNVMDPLSLQLSAGRGYHSPQSLAEYHYLLASSRKLVIEKDLKQESAWNFGTGVTSNLRMFGRSLGLSAEYYYTRFTDQLLLNLDENPHAAIIGNLGGRSYSHTFQIEASYNILSDLNFSAAYRLTDVKANYGNGMRQKPLTSRNKGLLTLGYTPNMGLWQLDITCALNGGGRNPDPYMTADGQPSWSERYHPYAQLNAQLTRNFRHWSIYIGGENITGYRQKKPIIDASDPWGPNFDATMVHAPIHGAMFYAGVRYNFTKFM